MAWGPFKCYRFGVEKVIRGLNDHGHACMHLDTTTLHDESKGEIETAIHNLISKINFTIRFFKPNYVDIKTKRNLSSLKAECKITFLGHQYVMDKVTQSQKF